MMHKGLVHFKRWRDRSFMLHGVPLSSVQQGQRWQQQMPHLVVEGAVWQKRSVQWVRNPQGRGQHINVLQVLYISIGLSHLHFWPHKVKQSCEYLHHHNPFKCAQLLCTVYTIFVFLERVPQWNKVIFSLFCNILITLNEYGFFAVDRYSESNLINNISSTWLLGRQRLAGKI